MDKFLRVERLNVVSGYFILMENLIAEIINRIHWTENSYWDGYEAGRKRSPFNPPDGAVESSYLAGWNDAAFEVWNVIPAHPMQTYTEMWGR